MAELGTWEQASISIPDFISDAATVINNVASFLNGVLNVALTIMNLIKSYTVSFIDPITALLEAVLQEVSNLLNSIRTIALSVAGDINLISYPFSDLLGGYSAYERRMVARFVDKTDPSRPDFPSSVKALGIFFYVNADVSAINQLQNFVKYFYQFFNKDADNTKPLPVPVNLKATYGTEGLTIYDFKELPEYFTLNPEKVADQAHLKWNVSASTNKDPKIPFVVPPPGGFLVEVSTPSAKDGIQIFYERPQADSNLVKGKGDVNVQVKDHGAVLAADGKPLTLFGGVDEIQIDDDLTYNKHVDSDGNLKKGAKRVYGKRSPDEKLPIPVSELKDGDKYLLQRNFFVSQVANAFFPGDGYGITVKKSDLPYEATFANNNGKVTVTTGKQPDTYFVRIAATTSKITSNTDFKHVIANAVFDTPGSPVKASTTKDSKGENFHLRSDRGDESTPVTLNFPSAETTSFLDSIVVALAILTLSRSDLPIAKSELNAGDSILDFQGKAKTATGLEGAASLLKRVYNPVNKKFKEKNVSATDFRNDLLARCRKVANDLYKSIGSNPNLEKTLASEAEILRTWKWTDSQNSEFQSEAKNLGFAEMTILESLITADNAKGGATEFGLGLNPWSVGVPEQVVDRDFFESSKGIMGSRDPGFLSQTTGPINLSSQLTEAQALEVIQKNPQLSNFLSRFRVVQDDGTVVYQIPDQYRQVSLSGQVRGSEDFSPVLFVNRTTLSGSSSGGEKGRVYFCRNVIDEEVYQRAALVLNVAGAALKRPNADEKWFTFRLFDGLPDLDQFLNTINNWLNTIKGGTKAVADAIVSYIDFLEARIVELQQLIRRITSLLNAVIQFNFPTANVLPVIGDGTDGLLSAFLAANNKPSDSSSTYGAGVVMVAGGVPSFLVDLIGGLV